MLSLDFESFSKDMWKVLSPREIPQLKIYIVKILCMFEMWFPTAFLAL